MRSRQIEVGPRDDEDAFAGIFVVKLPVGDGVEVTRDMML
jgi:hypothetical protein